MRAGTLWPPDPFQLVSRLNLAAPICPEAERGWSSAQARLRAHPLLFRRLLFLAHKAFNKYDGLMLGDAAIGRSVTGSPQDFQSERGHRKVAAFTTMPPLRLVMCLCHRESVRHA